MLDYILATKLKLREKGDSSRAREFLPVDKQYLITRNGELSESSEREKSGSHSVPCLRRATAINYTDADEDAEKLLSFLDEVSYIVCKEDELTYQAEEAPGPDTKGDEDWVATHIGRGWSRTTLI